MRRASRRLIACIALSGVASCRTNPSTSSESSKPASSSPAAPTTRTGREQQSPAPSGDAGSRRSSGVPRDDLWAPAAELAREMAAASDATVRKSGKMALYAYAFAGYALLSIARSEPSRTAEAASLVDALAERMSTEVLQRLYGPQRIVVAGKSVAISVAPRGHLALLLAGRARLAAGVEPAGPLLAELIEGLAEDILRDPNHLLPTYGARTWPADNEVVASALSSYVEQHPDARRAREALSALRGSLDALEKDGLPPSAVAADALAGTDVPRGCALSWTVVMRGLNDRDAALRLYLRYRRTYWVELGGAAGFREWPPGTDRSADIDSGPIVLGVGAAATALGIGAARLTGEVSDEAALLASAKLMELRRGTRTALAWHERAILAFVQSARAWK